MISLKNKILLLLALVILNSCSFGIFNSNDKEYLKGLVTQVKPKWFNSIKRFSLESQDGVASVNMFYDINPKLNLKSKTLSVFVHTPKESKYLNGFDIASGHAYSSKLLCGTYDSTKKYDRLISQANFSIGIVPRYLDQLNKAQKIIIFGGEDYILKYHSTHSIDVKVVGGYVERICPKGACLEVGDWLSRLVLVAVQRDDEEFKNISTIEELKKVVDWDYTLAFLKNGFGKNKVANNYYQAYQVGQFVDAPRALNFLSEKSTFFDINRLKTLQKSCFTLYDYAYKALSYKSISDMDTQSISNYKLKKNLENKLKAEGKEVIKNFARRFKEFYNKYGDEYLTCSKLVYSSNINDSASRHWLFYHLEAVFLLQDLGFSYRCGQKVWTQNSIMSDTKPMYSRKNEFLACSNEEIDMAFTLAPSILEEISHRGFSTYRYIDYDSRSHEKIYSWTSFTNKRFKCEKEKFNFYPKDVKWSR